MSKDLIIFTLSLIIIVFSIIIIVQARQLKQIKFFGLMQIVDSEEGKKIYSLVLEDEPENIDKMQYVKFKIVKSQNKHSL